MFRNYFIIAWRNLRQNRISSLINIIGLSAGLTCFIIIFLYVREELSFDRWNTNADRIYRVVKDFVNDDGTRIPDATTPPALAPSLRRDMPEVKYATRLFPSWGRRYLIQYKDKGFYETGLIRIDSNFFDVFDLPFIRGSKVNTFMHPQSIILTQAAAKKYFGSADPLGQVLHLNVNNGQDFAVTGVIGDVPRNSHFSFDFLLPFTSRRDSLVNNDWNWYSFYTYVVLKENAEAAMFRQKLQPLFNTYQPKSKDIYYAQPLTEIYLRSKLRWELGVNNDIAYIRILIVVALFVVMIAGINYVNLITARSIKRAKEVGVRKAAGASRQWLMVQFLTEAVCNAFIAMLFSLAAVELLLPFVNGIMDKNLQLFAAGQWALWGQLMAITLGIGLAAGIYPAFYLSAFRPADVLKDNRGYRRLGNVSLRKGLVVLQFVISIVLIVNFITIYRQVSFVLEKDLGFNKDNILLVNNVRATGRESPGPPGSWLDEVEKMSAVGGVARADGVPGGNASSNGVTAGNMHLALNFIRVDHAFLPTMGISLKEGRNFFPGRGDDSSTIILNERAVEELGLKQPWIGQRLAWDDEVGKTHPVTVVGVVKDFHFSSLHEAIKPFAFVPEENNGSTFFIRLRPKDQAAAIGAIQRTWMKYNPDKPFDYDFMDERVGKLYRLDIRFRNLFSCVTLLAVGIACLGLLGLSIFSAEARSKEIGIRKVLGASVVSLFKLLCRDVLLLIGIACVIAVPIAWWAVHAWLEGYAYHIAPGWWMFPVGGGVALIIALATTSYHAIKAALMNPVGALRSE
jgi:putative ABC transport system permease protein